MNGGMNYWIVKHTAPYQASSPRAQAQSRIGASFGARAAGFAKEPRIPSLYLAVNYLYCIDLLRVKWTYFLQLQELLSKWGVRINESRKTCSFKEEWCKNLLLRMLPAMGQRLLNSWYEHIGGASYEESNQIFIAALYIEAVLLVTLAEHEFLLGNYGYRGW